MVVGRVIRFCLVGRGGAMEGPGLLGRGGRPACDDPTWSLLRRTREVGSFVHRHRSTIRMDGSADSTSLAGWVGFSEGNDGGVQKGD